MKYFLIGAALIAAKLAAALETSDDPHELSYRSIGDGNSYLTRRGLKGSPMKSQARQRSSPSKQQTFQDRPPSPARRKSQDYSQQGPKQPEQPQQQPQQHYPYSEPKILIGADVAESIGAIGERRLSGGPVSPAKKQQRRSIDVDLENHLSRRSSTTGKDIHRSLQSTVSSRPRMRGAAISKLDMSSMGAGMLSAGARLPASYLQSGGKTSSQGLKADVPNAAASSMLSAGARIPTQYLQEDSSTKPAAPKPILDTSSMAANLLSAGARLPAEYQQQIKQRRSIDTINEYPGLQTRSSTARNSMSRALNSALASRPRLSAPKLDILSSLGTGMLPAGAQMPAQAMQVGRSAAMKAHGQAMPEQSQTQMQTPAAARL